MEENEDDELLDTPFLTWTIQDGYLTSDNLFMDFYLHIKNMHKQFNIIEKEKL